MTKYLCLLFQLIIAPHLLAEDVPVVRFTISEFIVEGESPLSKEKTDELLNPHLGEHEGQPYMVTELMGGGDVEGVIEDAPEHRLPKRPAVAWSSPTVVALSIGT